MVFLQYARDMVPKSLYESLTVTSKSRLTGEAVFRETVHRDHFIEDDYGLKTSNNITDHFKSIIEGTKAFEHEYLMEAFQKAKSGTTPRKKTVLRKRTQLKQQPQHNKPILTMIPPLHLVNSESQNDNKSKAKKENIQKKSPKTKVR